MSPWVVSGLSAATFVAFFAWFAWACTRAPIVESEGERRWREDREVASLDAAWHMPPYREGIHRA